MANIRTGQDFLDYKSPNKKKKKKKEWQYDPSLEEVESALSRRRRDRYKFTSRSKIKNF